MTIISQEPPWRLDLPDSLHGMLKYAIDHVGDMNPGRTWVMHAVAATAEPHEPQARWSHDSHSWEHESHIKLQILERLLKGEIFQAWDALRRLLEEEEDPDVALNLHTLEETLRHVVQIDRMDFNMNVNWLHRQLVVRNV